MSLSQLFGKTPKVTMKYGACRFVFDHIWSTSVASNSKTLKALCPKCNAVNDSGLKLNLRRDRL